MQKHDKARPVSRVLVTLTLCAAMANLGGCVLAVGNDGDGPDSGWSSSSEDYRSSLAHAVQASLAGDPLTRDADITVSAGNGRVYLSGTVHGPDVLTRVVELTLATPDVKSVRCRITVIR